jgi:hypothetical protein
MLNGQDSGQGSNLIITHLRFSTSSEWPGEWPGFPLNSTQLRGPFVLARIVSRVPTSIPPTCGVHHVLSGQGFQLNTTHMKIPSVLHGHDSGLSYHLNTIHLKSLSYVEWPGQWPGFPPQYPHLRIPYYVEWPG